MILSRTEVVQVHILHVIVTHSNISEMFYGLFISFYFTFYLFKGHNIFVLFFLIQRNTSQQNVNPKKRGEVPDLK